MNEGESWEFVGFDTVARRGLRLQLNESVQFDEDLQGFWIRVMSKEYMWLMLNGCDTE
jgi:hypothetical protein